MTDASERGGLDAAQGHAGLDGALARARPVKLMIFDVDGVMTDGTLYYSERGEELKAFNILDGHGIKMLKQYGVEVALITARKSRAVDLRAANLGIAHLYQGVADGTLYYSERGEELKAFNILDAHGIKILKQSGVEVALITARKSRAVDLRALHAV